MNKRTNRKKNISLLVFLVLAVPLCGFQLVRAAGCDPQGLVAVGAYQKGDNVVNLQNCLINAGFNIPAGATGYYGNQTVTAVKAFYASWYGSWNGQKIGPQGIVKLKEKAGGAPVAVTGGSQNFKNFASATDFSDYFKKAKQETQGGGYAAPQWQELGITAEENAGLAMDSAKSITTGATGSGAGGGVNSMAAPTTQISIDRVSQTNVQVAGIDEPDIIKTDGKKIYYSSANPVSWWSQGSGGISASPRCYTCESQNAAKIISALPVESMKIDSVLQKGGDLLLSGSTLAVFSNNEVSGYDVSDPKNPVQAWSIKPENNSSIIGARLYNGKIYMVARTYVGSSDVCPIRPLSIGGNSITVPCGSIYHPERVLPANALFSIFKINAFTGAVEARSSFAGMGSTSVVYMSANNLYITYPAYESEFKMTLGLLKDEMKDLVSVSLVDRLNTLDSYNISSAAKSVELNTILNDYRNSMSQDDKLKFNNEMANRRTNYRKVHKRDFDKTIIAKIDLSALGFVGSGTVPGQPLNQFSLDEYNGNLRIATTVGDSWFTRSETANDVYVLNNGMNVVGSVLDLGKTEKIYSARFIQDKGYVVTFRQTDPFYVIDLADPANPKLAGELKIPGYSGYLHPVDKDRIIGVGMENSKVKLSYFNVSNPANPIEMDKYSLDEYYSEAVSNHHAFLMDSKHQVFFMPGSNGGYIFSYANNRISLIKAVSDINPRRAVYVNDYLYIVGDSTISVINENNWQKIVEFQM